MPIVATPSTPVILTVDQVRRFMRDRPDYNILLDAVDYTQDDINQGIEMVTSRYNVFTPQTNLLAQSWPPHMQYVLLLGVAAYLIKSSAFLQLRNQATYQDGDVAPIGIDDKYPLYIQFAQVLDAEWSQLVQQVKIQNNLESAYGNLSSGYVNVSRYHHT
jgi:hypothetical protein